MQEKGSPLNQNQEKVPSV